MPKCSHFFSRDGSTREVLNKVLFPCKTNLFIHMHACTHINHDYILNLESNTIWFQADLV